jgi:hypothetical protein
MGLAGGGADPAGQRIAPLVEHPGEQRAYPRPPLRVPAVAGARRGGSSLVRRPGVGLDEGQQVRQAVVHLHRFTTRTASSCSSSTGRGPAARRRLSRRSAGCGCSWPRVPATPVSRSVTASAATRPTPVHACRTRTHPYVPRRPGSNHGRDRHCRRRRLHRRLPAPRPARWVSGGTPLILLQHPLPVRRIRALISSGGQTAASPLHKKAGPGRGGHWSGAAHPLSGDNIPCRTTKPAGATDDT